MPVANQQVVIGIDPGKSGGVAVIQGRRLLRSFNMPDTDEGLLDLLRSMKVQCRASGQHPIAYVEKVHAGPKMASRAAFAFGRGVGAIAVACLALSIKVVLVTPQRWQKEFGLLVKGRKLGEEDTEKKKRNRAKAEQLFPRARMTNATADAVLIAYYGATTHGKGASKPQRLSTKGSSSASH